VSRLLQHWVSEQAGFRPDAPAIVSGLDVLTYGALDALSTQVAVALRRDGCARGERVAVLMPKSPLAIAGLLGIYKADCVYVPLDPASPSRRLQTILDICDSRWLLAGGVGMSALESLTSSARGDRAARVGWLDESTASVPVSFSLGDVVSMPAGPIDSRNTPEDAAHILFTSGSTGTPKGVVITHANLVHFIDWAVRYLGIDATDRVSAHAPLPFDISFLDLFGAFATGAELHLVPAGLNVLPQRLAEFIQERALTQWFSVPSVLAYLAQFDVVRPGAFPSLKRVMWCGDVLPTPVLQYWMARVPHAAFINLYGPTEATVASSYYRVPACPSDAGAPIPIGTACDGEELLVLDESLKPVPIETVADLYLAGVGLAREYWKNPEQTAAAFLPHPSRPGEQIYKTGDLAHVGADGLVYFHGRRDAQVKSRGYRIELGEIETALNGLPGIHESAIVAIDTGRFEGAAICGAYVAAPGVELSGPLLNRRLQDLIPSYMLPSRWLAFDHLPRTANGKTDRRELKRLFEEQFHNRAAHSA
jgi:amino acid adenylation domain-containing protein